MDFGNLSDRSFYSNRLHYLLELRLRSEQLRSCKMWSIIHGTIFLVLLLDLLFNGETKWNLLYYGESLAATIFGLLSFSHIICIIWLRVNVKFDELTPEQARLLYGEGTCQDMTTEKNIYKQRQNYNQFKPKLQHFMTKFFTRFDALKLRLGIGPRTKNHLNEKPKVD